MTPLLQQLTIDNVHVSIADKTVLRGISLTVKPGEIHAIMGPNGSGKTTLAQVLMGNPKYTITAGTITVDGQDVTTLTPDKRSALGLFLAWQYPKEIPGVKLSTFVRAIYNQALRQRDPAAKKISPMVFKKVLDHTMSLLHMDPTLADRYLNTGFSGGEKKKSEMLQMALLQPRYAILDETDSGLDVDALRIVCDSVNQLKATSQLGVLLITHYNRILDYITPDQVHVLIDGQIVHTGDKEFAREVEAKGYDWLRA